MIGLGSDKNTDIYVTYTKHRGNCDFVLSIKLAVETPMLLRDQLLDLFTTSQVVKQSTNYANYSNLLASDFNTHQ